MTPRTDALIAKHQAELARQPATTDPHELLRLAQRHCLELAALARALERGE